LRQLLEHLRHVEAERAQETFAFERADWRRKLREYKALFPSGHTPENFAGGEACHPFSLPFAEFFVKLLARHCPDDAVVCVDVGQHQMWAGQSFCLRRGQRLLFSGGMGAMGFALPAGIGAAFAAKASRIVVLVGDGGLQVNIQELDLLAFHRLPVTIVVLDNGCLGMVRQFQDLYFGGRRQSTVVGYSRPDFVRIAEAYGIPAWHVRSEEEAEEGLRRAMSVSGPSLLRVELPLETVVQPKLVVNHPVEDMSPPLDPAFLRSLLLVEPLGDRERS
jgi:acetolactate synthase-1/2/3 large subunit